MVCEASRKTAPAPEAPKTDTSLEFAALVLRPTLSRLPLVALKVLEPKGAVWSAPPKLMEPACIITAMPRFNCTVCVPAGGLSRYQVS